MIEVKGVKVDCSKLYNTFVFSFSCNTEEFKRFPKGAA